MPVRKKTTRTRRLNENVVSDLRAWIRSGEPWTIYGFGSREPIFGDGDVKGLIDITFDFSLDLCRNGDDEEMFKLLWQELGDDILAEHIKYDPGTRPAGWWRFAPEADEARRMVEIVDEDDGEAYQQEETERAYLERNELLTDYEKELFARFGEVIRVRRAAAATIANCEECWNIARATAADIGFDLLGAIKFEKFWIPRALFFVCQHRECLHGNDCIFDEI
jgi:hypothetical protein